MKISSRLPKAVATCATVLSALHFGGLNAQLDPVSQLDELMQGIDTLSSEVLQLIVESDGGILEESEIQMYLKKPDGFYWETISPFPELIVTNGIKLWNYQPDLEQVVVEDWDSSRSELAAQLLNGQTDNLAEEYLIEKVATDSEEFQEFELIPIASDSIYQKISINFASDELDMIYLNNKNGQRTVWQFENIQRNEPLQSSLFEFTPPSGIEVIENNYAQ